VRGRTRVLTAIALVSIAALAAVVASAGTTGKIEGVVRDRQTGEPLPGVNIILEQTTLGAATDHNGHFFIINVPPGVYNVTARMIGYVTTTVRGVRVTVDLTTRVNFELEPTVVDLGREIVVEAERPLIQPEVTAKRNVYTAEMISNMPVNTVQDIMTLSSGIIQIEGYQNKIAGFDARGLDQTHVRGGRSGQIAYMIDGVYVEDAIYAGMGTQVNREAIDELTVITGAFDAEYGEAQSAVVNIVTKEGASRFSSMLEMNSGEVAGWLGSERDDLRNAHQVIGSVSGPVPLPFLRGLSFFLSGEQAYRKYAVLEYDKFTFDPTPLTDVLNNPNDPRYKQIEQQIQAGIITEAKSIDELKTKTNRYRYVGDVLRHWATGAWRKAWSLEEDWGLDHVPGTRDSLEGDGISELIRWDDKAGWRAFGFYTNWDITGKLTWRLSPSLKLLLPFSFNERRFRNYDFWYTFAEKGRHIVTDRTERQGIFLTHQISPRMFYEIRASRFWKYRKYRVYGINDHELTPGHADLFQQFIPNADFGPQEYPSPTTHGGFYDDLVFVRYDTLPDGRIKHVYYGSPTQYWTRNYQQTWQLQGSMTWQIHRNHQVKMGFDYKRHDLWFLEIQHPYIANPYPEYYYTHPIEASAYIQDKMEFQSFIVNAGLRWDFADSKGRAWRDWSDPTSGVVQGKKKWQLSPRLGIGYPITDKSTFHFAYGHFFQVPDYRDLYTNQTLNLNSPLPLFGWANMDAARTIQYEIGVDQQFGEDWKLSVAAWAKENNGDPGSYRLTGFDPDSLGLYSYSIITNSDFGSSRGLDIGLHKRLSHYYFLDIEYTWSVAKANKYYSWAGYWEGDTEESHPKREYLMPWDRTHVIDAAVGFALPPGGGPRVLGLRPLQNMTYQFIVRAGSGYPYTPTVGGQALEPNTARRPWMFTIDAVVRKDFLVGRSLRVGMLARVYNLLDRKNVLEVYSETGSPTDPGPYMSRTATSTYYDRPHHFGSRRFIDLGLRIEFR